ncbi:unnamed protein product [Xylocopa violacea]|uniref:Uncharacterized protein n=2 Tax=Xylocopa violacea TaxID=135666 RepID=A0ABP1P9S7_XYLVO
MFRDGQYLEVIKASDNYVATAIVTVQEKTIKMKEKKVSTNKWLNLEDWAALYKILEKAILRNVHREGSHQDFKKCKWKKSTRQFEVTYSFEPSENVKDVTSLPTIRVNVSPTKKKSVQLESHETVLKKEEICSQVTGKVFEKTSNYIHRKDDGNALLKNKLGNSDVIMKPSSDMKNGKNKRYLSIDSLKNDTLEEYVPDTPMTKKLCANFNYVPSRKSMLEQTQISSNEYSPMISDDSNIPDIIRYIPNSIDSSKISYETYEPSTKSIINNPEEYVPNSKGVKASIEEYHPDFTSKTMKFDDSYVPSRVQLINENSKKLSEGHKKLQAEKHMPRQIHTLMKRNMNLFT